MTNRLRIKDIAINASGFVFDPYSGATFTLNSTGQAIVKALRDGLFHDQIVARLRSEFDDVTLKLDEDVADFIRSLRDFGLLQDHDHDMDAE